MRFAKRAGALALVQVLCTYAEPVRAEVSVLADAEGRAYGTLMMWREGSSPSEVWKKFRAVEDHYVLNPQGDGAGDGPPDIAFDPVSGRAQVVWAQRSDAGSEVVLAHWDGERWTSSGADAGRLIPSAQPFSRDAALRLSPSPGAWSAPRLAIGGNRMTRVVWSGEEDGLSSVWYHDLSLASGDIGDPVRVHDSALSTRDPSLLIGFDRIFIAVEQEESGLRLVVVIQAEETDFVTQRDSEPFRRRVISITLSVGRLNLALNIEGGTGRARWDEDPARTGNSDYLQDIDNWSNPWYTTTDSSGSFGP
jgi:hypothetical protein